MLTFTQFFSSIFLIISTLFNSIIPLVVGNDLADDRFYDKWSPEDTYVIDYDGILKKMPVKISRYWFLPTLS